MKLSVLVKFYSVREDQGIEPAEKQSHGCNVMLAPKWENEKHAVATQSLITEKDL